MDAEGEDDVEGVVALGFTGYSERDTFATVRPVERLRVLASG